MTSTTRTILTIAVLTTVVLALANFSGRQFLTQTAPSNTPALPSPTNLTATPISQNQINLAWSYPSGTNESGFAIERTLDTTCTLGFAVLASVNRNTTTYSNTGLTPNAFYCYRVRAFKKVKSQRTYFGYSNTAGAITPKAATLPSPTPPPPPPPPPPPADTIPPAITNVSATSITETGAAISWTTDEVSDSLVEYGKDQTPLVYESFQSNISLVISHQIVLTGLLSGTTYNYRAKSKDVAGNLAVSNNFTFTTIASPLPPPPPPPSLGTLEAVQTFAPGEDAPYQFIMLNGKIFAALRTKPTKILRFNDPTGNLSNYDVYTFPNDLRHELADDIVALNGKLYVTFSNPATGGTVVSEVDASTFNVATDVIVTPETMGQGALETDGTYLYVAWDAPVPTFVRKYETMGWTVVAYRKLCNDDTCFGTGELKLADGALWLTMANTCFSIHGAPWAFKLDPRDLSILASARYDNNTQRFPTNDLAVINNGMWSGFNCLGFDNIARDVVRLETTDLTKPIAVPVGGSASGVFALNGKLYATVIEKTTNYSHIVEISPLSPYTTIDHPLDQAYKSIEGILSDGQYMWALFVSSPGALGRISL